METRHLSQTPLRTFYSGGLEQQRRKTLLVQYWQEIVVIAAI